MKERTAAWARQAVRQPAMGLTLHLRQQRLQQRAVVVMWQKQVRSN